MAPKTSADEAARRLKAIELAKASGVRHPMKLAADSLGIPSHRLIEWARTYQPPDPAIMAAMAAVKTQMVPTEFWAKTGPDADGISYSARMRPKVNEESAEEIAGRIADRLNAIIPAPPITRPQSTSADLLNFLPVYDVHMGMRIGSYGTAQAVERLKEGAWDVLDRAPRAETIIILSGGDYTEANDNSAQTPQSKHPLAVDMDFDDLTDIAVDTKISLIEYAMTKADRVIYQTIKGNHDPHMSIALRQALRQRYRDNPRFELKDGFKLFVHEWEGNLLAAIHGDAKVTDPKLLALSIATKHPGAWGRSRRREFWRGHNHKELTISVPGMTTLQVNPVCPSGNYANDNLFVGDSDIQCVTYGKGGRRCGLALHTFDNPERAGL